MAKISSVRVTYRITKQLDVNRLTINEFTTASHFNRILQNETKSKDKNSCFFLRLTKISDNLKVVHPRKVDLVQK